MRAEPQRDLDALCAQWSLSPHSRLATALEGAAAAFDIGDATRATSLLRVAIDAPELASLHASWPLDAARVASRIGDKSLAERFLAFAPLRGPGDLGPHRSEELEEACNTLIAGVIVRAALGIAFAPTVPRDRLLKGVQHHLVAIATAFGEVRVGRPVTAAMIARIAGSALNYLAGARYQQGEDDMIVFRLPMLGQSHPRAAL